MTKIVDHIQDNIAEIASNNFSNGQNGVEESFQNTLNDISKFMENLGINDQIISDIMENLSSKFDNLVKDGNSLEDSFKETFDNISSTLNSSISNDSTIGLGRETDEYDLSYASSLVNDKTLLIDDAISKGMSVEDAIKYVNNKTNFSNDETYGPSKYVNSENIENTSNFLTKTDDEIKIDKMEADMDEQANKLDRESIKNLDNSNKENLVDTLNEKLQDDELS